MEIFSGITNCTMNPFEVHLGCFLIPIGQVFSPIGIMARCTLFMTCKLRKNQKKQFYISGLRGPFLEIIPIGQV